MKSIFRSLLVLACLLVLTPSTNGAESVRPSKGRYWTWVNYDKKRDWDSYFQELQSVGIEGILIQSGREGLEHVIPIASKYGIEVQAWLWVMNNGGLANAHPEWLDYNAHGNSLRDSIAYVGYYKFLNPAIPEVRVAIGSALEDISKIPSIAGVSLDYCRYVDAILPEKLQPAYGIVQDKIYPRWDYGYHPAMIADFKKKYGHEPKADDPAWLDFRCEVLNDFVDSLSVLIHSQGVPITASPFPTPEMSKHMVRQDWGKWPLDMAFPMIYHGFYRDSNGQNAGLEWIAQCVRDCRRDAQPNTKIYYGMHIPDFANSNGPSITEAVDIAIANGAEGFAIFTFDSLSQAQKEELRKIIKKLNVSQSIPRP